MNYFLYILTAIGAITLQASGNVLMKRGISGGRVKKEKKWKSRVIWFTGFMMINIYNVPIVIAINKLQPHVVSSLAGWGVLISIAASYFIFHEKITRETVLYGALIIMAIFTLNFFEEPVKRGEIMIPGYIGFTSVPLLLLGSLIFFRKKSETSAVIMAAAAGISVGIITLSFKMLTSGHGLKVVDYFSSPYLYVILAASLTNFIPIQIAYRKADFVLVNPLYQISNIITSTAGSLIIFRNSINMVQILSILIIIYSIRQIIHAQFVLQKSNMKTSKTLEIQQAEDLNTENQEEEPEA
jgi:multidrug transporter EmrE-like cation transporter